MRYLYAIALGLLLSLNSGCGTMSFGKSMVVTGETIKGVGNEFVAVGAAYKSGCDVTRTIPQSQCQSFRQFGLKFQTAFPLSTALWETARAQNDDVMKGNVEAIITDLATKLSEFALQVGLTIGGK